MNSISVISGPTGSGKTQLALELPLDPSVPLVNCDAFQFYREIPVLSSQPTEQCERFRFLADRSVLEPLNAGEFSRKVAAYLSSPALLVGTGLYLGSALYGLDEDRRKGTPFQGEARVKFRMLVLDPPRADLYSALDRRVDLMLEGGALAEAEYLSRAIADQKLSDTHPLLRAIGLKHLLDFLQKKSSWEECLFLWKRDTRRLAKRQWTWLRKFCPPSPHIRWCPPQSISKDLIKWLIDAKPLD